MHYPWWYVPHLTSPMLIALIAVVHVLVSHYAVGGGLFLAVETGYAYRTKDRAYLDYLHRHARFFILLTVVYRPFQITSGSNRRVLGRRSKWLSYRPFF